MLIFNIELRTLNIEPKKMEQYRANLLICVEIRCVASGSLKVKQALGEELKKQNIQNEIWNNIEQTF